MNHAETHVDLTHPVPFDQESIEQFPELQLGHAPMCVCGDCPWVRWSTNHATSSYGIPVLLVGPSGDQAPARSYASVAEAVQHEPTFHEGR